MNEMKITLSIIWVAVMLTYLLGDVLRFITGQMVPGEMMGAPISQGMALGMAVLMVLPILMVVLSLLLPQGVNRWANIIMAGFWLLFNLVGLPGYEGHYDKFLLLVSIVFNGVTIWYAWNWV